MKTVEQIIAEIERRKQKLEERNRGKLHWVEHGVVNGQFTELEFLLNFIREDN